MPCRVPYMELRLCVFFHVKPLCERRFASIKRPAVLGMCMNKNSLWNCLFVRIATYYRITHNRRISIPSVSIRVMAITCLSVFSGRIKGTRKYIPNPRRNEYILIIIIVVLCFLWSLFFCPHYIG